MSGRAWVLGDDVDTDALAPGLYMKGPIEALASHCLEAIEPAFAGSVRAGDVVVAGRNFGLGSSREQAAEVLAHLGIAAVVATSFAGIFYRNAFNNGLPAVVCAEAARVRHGEQVAIDAAAGVLTLERTGERIPCEPIPEHLMQIVRHGGLVPYLEYRLAEQGCGR